MINKPYSPEAFAEFLAEGLRAALLRGPFASLAVSGGRTPETVFPQLCRQDLDWSRVRITLTDERWLPPEHAGSNEGLVRRLLLKEKAARARFVGFWDGLAASPEAALPGLERRLGEMPWPLDAVFLGLGPDGHIASLFPGDPALEAEVGRVAAAHGPPPFGPRITLTLPELARARAVGLAANSPEKQAVLLNGGPGLPVHRLLSAAKGPVAVFG